MTSKEIGFLNEVAAELVSRGITDPTVEQIAEAMSCRLTRQSDLYNRLFENPLWSVASDKASSFRHEVAASVYREVRR